MADFDWSQCETRVFVHEGGYTNDPRDPGGPTNHGVTIADARRFGAKYHWVTNPSTDDIARMPLWFAVDVFKTEYWNALACDSLTAGVDDSVFDYGVSSGIGRAGKVLRRVVGLSDSTWRVTADVIVAVSKRDPITLINAINNERMQFLRALPTFDHFGRGWTVRVKEVQSFSRQLALAAKARPEKPASVKAAFTQPLPTQPMAKAIVPGPDAGPPAILVGGLAGMAVLSGPHTMPFVIGAGAVAAAAGGAALLAEYRYRRDFEKLQHAPSGGEIVVPAAQAA